MCGFSVSGCDTSPDQASRHLRIGIGLEPPNLDPTSGAAAAVDEVVYANLFEGLTRIDESGQVQPLLATRWDISDDQLQYEFWLVTGARFHNGIPFDSSVAQFALERITAAGSTNAQQQLFANIESITSPSPDRLIIKLSKPEPDLLFNLGWGDAVMVEPSSAQTNASHPVGTGPYRFERWITGTSITLARSPDYWGEPVFFEHVTFKMIGDAASAYGAIMAGDIDGTSNFGAPELIKQLEGTGRFKITEGMTEGETVLALNARRAPFDNPDVRRAIAQAINRTDLINGALFGYGTPIGSFFSPMHPEYVDLSDVPSFDPGAARQALQDAALAPEYEAVMKLPPVGYARRSGEIIAAQLRAVGLSVKIEPIEWAQWLSTVFGQGDYDMTIVSHTEPQDIGFFARPNNYFGYESEVFNAAIAARDWSAAQRILADDQAAVFLFQLPQVGVWDKSLSGQWANAPIQANDVTDIRRATP